MLKIQRNNVYVSYIAEKSLFGVYECVHDRIHTLFSVEYFLNLVRFVCLFTIIVDSLITIIRNIIQYSCYLM